MCHDACSMALKMLEQTVNNLISMSSSGSLVHKALVAAMECGVVKVDFAYSDELDREEMNRTRIFVGDKDAPLGCGDYSHLIKVTYGEPTGCLCMDFSGEHFSQIIVPGSITVQNLAVIIHDVALDIYTFNHLFRFEGLSKGIPVVFGKYISQKKYDHARGKDSFVYGCPLDASERGYVSLASLCRSNLEDGDFSLEEYVALLNEFLVFAFSSNRFSADFSADKVADKIVGVLQEGRLSGQVSREKILNQCKQIEKKISSQHGLSTPVIVIFVSQKRPPTDKGRNTMARFFGRTKWTSNMVRLDFLENVKSYFPRNLAKPPFALVFFCVSDC